MSSKPSDTKSDGGAPETTALHTLLSALAHEFTRAAAGHDATMAAWSELYASTAMFAGRSPSGMKIVSAQVKLPVAIASVVPTDAVVGRLTPAQLTEALDSEIPKGARQKMAMELCAQLTQNDQGRLNDRNLKKNVLALLKARFPDALKSKASIDGYLTALQRERRENTERPPETRVVYRTADLAALSPDQVMTLNLEYRLE